jgi:hypothetical protein
MDAPGAGFNPQTSGRPRSTIRRMKARLWFPIAMALCLNVNAQHGKRVSRLAVRNATIVEGVGTPAAGPRDILIENGRITSIVSPEAGRQIKADFEIDARGKYVLPGFINLHGHVQEERAGIEMPVEYCLKLWLACGITTVRDVGSNFALSKKLREQSAQGSVVAPRLILYRMFGGAANYDEARAVVRKYKEEGADGVKFLGVPRDVMQGLLEEAKAQGLRTAHHTGVEETNTWDDIRWGTTSIEHWYGVPDAALADGVQNFPPSYNYANELDRFRYAGRLWREADPTRLGQLLDAMAKAGLAWDPTFSIYEASRDIDKAQNQPYFQEYLHPTLEAFFRPDLTHHGSFFVEWTTADEVYWKENYRIWMNAVREFERRGGVVGTGEDAGYIYRIYGFGYLRELELHQEAGFHPLKVIQHATANGARILGKEYELGRVRAGWAADLIVVNGNPLENLRVLYPHNPKGGIAWVVKDGIPYDVATLRAEIIGMVAKDRARRPQPMQHPTQ